MDIAAALRAFAAVFPAELPDKTMLATVVLVAQYRRPLLVWCGAAAAFTIHVIVAVTAGQLLTLLPDTVVALVTGAMFAAGAVYLWHDATKEEEADDDDAASNSPASARSGALGIMGASFGVILLAEWGDLTQIATASTAASTGAPVAVALGALLALWSVAALAAIFGQAIVSMFRYPNVPGAYQRTYSLDQLIQVPFSISAIIVSRLNRVRG